ncbi:ankyrin repeat-containing protein ITN1 [Trifolium repens]|nr:ankyrin repeat-containing protein ITN1 [Trifolium repens]
MLVVESIVPPVYTKAKNNDGLNPRELFTKNHEQLLNEARQWVKETANLFIVVGTLITTIMFAAAFTVPGGNNQNKGTPIFFGKSDFSVFIILDALSLVTSASVVLIFTGILTTRYSEEDFSPTLLLKLVAGIYVIYSSALFMMFTFIGALSLMLKGRNLVSETATIFTLLPILVFTVMMKRLINVLL